MGGIVHGFSTNETDAFLFYNNQIQGTIPGEIGNLDQLTWIDMEDNSIVGTIPESFYTNLELEEVIFKKNFISGTLSDSVGDLSKLTTFWASFNQFTGTIPSTFGLCTSLEELELQNNKLGGSIPDEFENMRTMEFLPIESNQLMGTIPGGLARWSSCRLRATSSRGPSPAVSSARTSPVYEYCTSKRQQPERYDAGELRAEPAAEGSLVERERPDGDAAHHRRVLCIESRESC